MKFLLCQILVTVTAGLVFNVAHARDEYVTQSEAVAEISQSIAQAEFSSIWYFLGLKAQSGVNLGNAGDDWLALSIAKSLAVLTRLEFDIDSLSPTSVEAFCVLEADQSVLDPVQPIYGDSPFATFFKSSSAAFRNRLSKDQALFGGSGCSHRHSSGDVFTLLDGLPRGE